MADFEERLMKARQLLFPTLLGCGTLFAAGEPDKGKPAVPPVELKITEKVLGEYDWSRGIVISSDQKHAAWTVARTFNGEKKLAVVVDGEEGKQLYDQIDDPFFSPDGKRVAFTAKRGDKCVAVIDGVEGKEYSHIEDLETVP
jgi:WD40-like Beta Propeller Repeat